MTLDRPTPETPLARYERQGGGPLDGPGMLYRKEPGGGYAHVSRDVDDLVCFAAAVYDKVAAAVQAILEEGDPDAPGRPWLVQRVLGILTNDVALAAKPEEETT